jgi:hypothetical protein
VSIELVGFADWPRVGQVHVGTAFAGPSGSVLAWHRRTAHVLIVNARESPCDLLTVGHVAR